MQLSRQERAGKAFQVPSVTFPNSREWARGLDARVADMQIQAGNTRARPGMPYYGCSGGAYEDKARCYGQFVKMTRRNSVAAKMFGESEGTLTAWVEAPSAGAVSYTHLTLPTTPYV